MTDCKDFAHDTVAPSSKQKFPKHHNRLDVVCYENSQDVEYGAPTLRGEAGILTYVACVSS